jgi:ferredoxin
MQIRIDAAVCTGHGRCYSLAPDLLEPDDDGYGAVTQSEVPPHLVDAARQAAASCPERAVHLDA